MLTAAQLAGAFSEYGDPGGTPLVLLHGLRLGRESWKHIVAILKRRHHVLTLDLPGHGTLVDVPFTQAAVDRQLDYIAGYLARPPVLLGYSLGGYVAMGFAQRRAGLTAGLILAGCSLDITGWKRVPYAAVVSVMTKPPRAVVRALTSTFFRLRLPEDLARIVVSAPFNDEVYRQVPKVVSGTRYSEKLRAYTKPVLFVNGKWDAFMRPSERRFAGICGAEVSAIAGAEHTLPLRHPREFSATVDSFMQRHFAAPE